MTTASPPKVAWQPHPGFQTAFTACAAFEVLGGGAAGPGKTDCLIADAARHARHPAARGLFLRTIFTDLLDVQDRMQLLYPKLGATYSEKHRRWTFPSGGTVELGYGKSLKEINRYLGREYTRIWFDELGLLTSALPWDQLLSRIRSTDPTIQADLGARGSANPGGPGHGWLKARFIDSTSEGARIHLDTESGITRAFVPGRAKDNPTLPASYWRRLNALPEPMRSWLRDGKWDAGLGLAFTATDLHLVKPFRVPEYWTIFGAFDWGFRHPFAFGLFAVSEDGDYFLIDTVWGRGQKPSAIAESIVGHFHGQGLLPRWNRGWVTYAGRDCFAEQKARTEGDTPSIADLMAPGGVILHPANVARVLGWNNLREFLAMPDGSTESRLRIMETRGNVLVLRQIQAAVTDPDRPEDVLKVDATEYADPGTEGDDGLDMLRFAVASRQAGHVAQGREERTLNDPRMRAMVAALQGKVTAAERGRTDRGYTGS